MNGVDPSHRYAVILAGGHGTRMWPISTARQPKQFQALNGTRTLIGQTFDRMASLLPVERIFVSTTIEYADDVRRSLPLLPPDNLIVEPHPEGKPAAFVLIASRLRMMDPDAIVLSLAADSYVSPLAEFHASCEKSFEFVEAHPGWTTLLGSVPSRPDVSLGYVRADGAAMGVDGVHVARDFHEKPDFEAATQFLFAGDYYWNSSHYCFSVETLLEAYRQAAPRLVEAISEYVETGLASAYVSADSPAQELMPFIASGHPIGVVASSFTWSDLGTWPSLYRALAGPDGSAVVASGRTFDTDSTASLVVNDSRMTVITAGLEGVAVVVSGSIVLVLPMKRLEDDPSILESLRARFDRDIHEDPRENSV